MVRWTVAPRWHGAATCFGATQRERSKQRKALLMATGEGKTRTVIALVDLLMRAGWVKRALFLADRTALVNQAVNAFKTHLPDSAPVNLVTEGNVDGRVCVSTYQTMVGISHRLCQPAFPRLAVCPPLLAYGAHVPCSPGRPLPPNQRRNPRLR